MKQLDEIQWKRKFFWLFLFAILCAFEFVIAEAKKFVGEKIVPKPKDPEEKPEESSPH